MEHKQHEVVGGGGGGGREKKQRMREFSLVRRRKHLIAYKEVMKRRCRQDSEKFIINLTKTDSAFLFHI